MQIGDRYWWEKRLGERYEVEIASPLISPAAQEGPVRRAAERIMVRVLNGLHRGTMALVDPAELSKIQN